MEGITEVGSDKYIFGTAKKYFANERVRGRVGQIDLSFGGGWVG